MASLSRHKRITILGVEVSPSTMKGTAERVAEAVRSRRKLRLAFCTAHMMTESQRDPALKEAVNGCDVVATDGMPLVWLCRLKGAGYARRVYGPDAMLAFCEYGLEHGWRHYFYGATPAKLHRLEGRLRASFPGLQVAGSYSPPFRALTPAEKQDVARRINAAQPDLVWVGLGMPKQELWAAEFQPALDAPVILAVGAAFDFHSGAVKQAPPWMQRSGTEWLFRLSQEPGRLWRRYLIGNAVFVWLLAKEFITSRQASRETAGRTP